VARPASSFKTDALNRSGTFPANGGNGIFRWPVRKWDELWDKPVSDLYPLILLDRWRRGWDSNPRYGY
jgi:hypothetical protein